MQTGHFFFVGKMCPFKKERCLMQMMDFLSRAHCMHDHRQSCSTFDLLDTDHRDSSTQHTWGWSQAEDSRQASLITAKSKKYDQLQNSFKHLGCIWGCFLLCCSLTYVRCHALMSTPVGAALFLVGAVTVIRAKFSAPSVAQAPARTHSWFY